MEVGEELTVSSCQCVEVGEELTVSSCQSVEVGEELTVSSCQCGGGRGVDSVQLSVWRWERS